VHDIESRSDRQLLPRPSDEVLSGRRSSAGPIKHSRSASRVGRRRLTSSYVSSTPPQRSNRPMRRGDDVAIKAQLPQSERRTTPPRRRRVTRTCRAGARPTGSRARPSQSRRPGRRTVLACPASATASAIVPLGTIQPGIANRLIGAFARWCVFDPGILRAVCRKRLFGLGRTGFPVTPARVSPQPNARFWSGRNVSTRPTFLRDRWASAGDAVARRAWAVFLRRRISVTSQRT
jgi:hypothetical protein